MGLGSRVWGSGSQDGSVGFGPASCWAGDIRVEGLGLRV